MTETLKEKARDALVTFTEKDRGGESLSSLNKKQQSIAAVRFYIKEIRNPLKAQIEDDDLEDGMVDGANDLGCDFLYRDDGHVLIIQAKYHRPGFREEPSDIAYFQQIFQRFRNPDLAPNKYLADMLSDIKWESDSFELVFLTFGKIDGQARVVSAQDPQYPASFPDLVQRCDWSFFDENDLNEELRSARNLQRGPSTKTIKIYPKSDEKGQRGKAVVEVKAGEYRSYIMALDAMQLIRCYQELGKDALFSLNIRNFIGNTTTNKSIIDTAEKNADNFFLYNNGIACLANKVKQTDEALELTGLQVINGAQTVKALVNVEKSHRRGSKPLWSAGAPTILVRITEVPDSYGAGGRVREKITQYNNTQNTIKISDFRSNDDVQNNLKDQFAELWRKGRKVLYAPKRTDKQTPGAEVVRLEEFSKAIYAFLFDPTEFSGSTSFLFNTDSDGGYVRVFGDGEKIWEKMPDDEFKMRAGVYWVSQEFAARLKVVRELEAEPDNRAALERKWLVLFAAKYVFEYYYPNDVWKTQLRKLSKGDWTITDDKKGIAVSKIFDAAKMGVILAYKTSKRSNPNFVHRNWMRGKNTPTEITDLLGTVLPSLPAPPDIAS